jgi:hypothetical protein
VAEVEVQLQALEEDARTGGLVKIPNFRRAFELTPIDVGPGADAQAPRPSTQGGCVMDAPDGQRRASRCCSRSMNK